MSNTVLKIDTYESYNGMTPSIIRAAESGNLAEGKSALSQNPSCIHEEFNIVNHMNALQVALCCMQTEFGIFLLDNTNISTHHKDSQGRDACDLALMCSNDELGEAVYKRWIEELNSDDYVQNGNITKLKPS